MKSFLSFKGWTPAEIAAFAPRLVKCAENYPATFVDGAKELPIGRDEVIEFFSKAGFSKSDAEKICSAR